MMYKKPRSDERMPSQIKPTGWVHLSHNLQGHSSVSQFLILDLSVDKDDNSL